MAEWVPPPPDDEFVVYDGADLPAVDADSVLLDQRYERTTPRDTGTAYDLGAWIRADRARREEAGTFDPGGHTEIVAPSWSPPVDDLPTKPKALVKRLTGTAWDVRSASGIVFVSPTLFVSATEGEDGHGKGDVRYEEHYDTWFSVQAVLRTGPTAVAAFWATWTMKEQVGAKTSTKFDNVSMWDLVLHSTFTKKATEFEEWLAVFAPVPQKPRKPGAETPA